MEVNVQLHAPATLPLGIERSVHYVRESDWAPEPV
jgi:hypothetical protein